MHLLGLVTLPKSCSSLHIVCELQGVNTVTMCSVRNLSFTIHTARGPTGEVTLGKFHWGLFWHSCNCKGFETSTGHETVRTLHRSSI